MEVECGPMGLAVSGVPGKSNAGRDALKLSAHALQDPGHSGGGRIRRTLCTGLVTLNSSLPGSPDPIRPVARRSLIWAQVGGSERTAGSFALRGGREECNGEQPGSPKEGFVTGPRTQNVQEIHKYRISPTPSPSHKSGLGEGT